MKQPVIICDVNGVLGDCSQRAHFLEQEPRDWDSYFRHMMVDRPVDFVHRFVNAQASHPFFCEVVLITGSPEKYRSLMMEWLKTNEVRYDHLYMRGNYEFIKGFEFKRKLYLDELQHKFDIVCILEDNEECAKMYRDLGLHCWLVANCPYPRRDATTIETQTVGRATTRGNRVRSARRRPRAR